MRNLTVFHIDSHFTFLSSFVSCLPHPADGGNKIVAPKRLFVGSDPVKEVTMPAYDKFAKYGPGGGSDIAGNGVNAAPSHSYEVRIISNTDEEDPDHDR